MIIGVTNVANILAKQEDSTGTMIETVYAKVVPSYAVYRTAERVIVQYADDEKLGSDQRQALIASNPVKGEINGLIDGWRKSANESAKTRARLFDRRVADALVVALQGDQAHAVELLNQIKADIVAERTSIARTSYLFTSCATTAAFLLIFGPFYWPITPANDNFAASLCLSAAVGAIGAFFSIALAIRGRQIGTDLQWRDNHTDAGLRVTIGAISGVVLYCLLHAKVVTVGFGNVSIGGTVPDGSFDVKLALMLVTAFAAGFTERLVGDLFGRAAFGTTAPTANPLAGKAGVATTAVARQKIAANEANPLGRPAPTTVAEHAPALPDQGDLLDGCLDHATLSPDEITRDVELPDAMGGVAGRA